jgi:hypothetical protein
MSKEEEIKITKVALYCRVSNKNLIAILKRQKLDYTLKRYNINFLFSEQNNQLVKK